MEIKDSGERREEWRDCIGYEGLYLVSSMGRVKSLYVKTRITDKNEGIISQKYDSHGYKKVNLHKNGKQKSELVSRLVATAFIPNETNLPMVGHLDDDKTNNLVTNLYWTDSSENNHHNGKYERLLKAHNEKIDIIAAKLSKSIIATEIATGKEQEFVSMQSASKILGVDSGKISLCCNGKRNKSRGYKFRWK